MAIVTNEKAKELFGKYAKELHDLARCHGDKDVSHVCIEALANILDKIVELDIPFKDLDRFCYFAIKDANKEIEGMYYTPDEALAVVQDAIYANPPLSNEKEDGNV